MGIINVLSSDIYDKDQKNCDDVRSILKMNMMVLYWFRLSQRVKVLCPVSLYYAIKFDASIGYGLLLL
jgi:hypothetical protein